MIAGRELPHSLDAEAGLLACCIIDGTDVISRCHEGKLTPESFYSPAHRSIFEALLRIFERKAAADLIVLCEELNKSGELSRIGGPAFVSSLTNRVGSTAHAGQFIEIIREKHALRRLIVAATAAVEQCFKAGDSFDEVAAALDRELTSIRSATAQTIRPIGAIVDEVDRTTREQIANPDKNTRGILPTGLASLDRMAGLARRGWLSIIAGRTSQGKSSLAVQMAHQATRLGLRTAFFTLETDDMSPVVRMTQQVSGVASDLIGHAPRDMQRRYLETLETMRKLPLVISAADLSIDAIVSRCRREAARGLDVVIVDYLQLVGTRTVKKEQTREREVAEISRALKLLAGELRVVVVALSQLSRAGDDDERPPMLKHLRESGSLEQDADRVIFVWQPAKDRSGNPQRPLPGENPMTVDAQIIVAKNRDGPTPAGWATFHRPTTAFRED